MEAASNSRILESLLYSWSINQKKILAQELGQNNVFSELIKHDSGMMAAASLIKYMEPQTVRVIVSVLLDLDPKPNLNLIVLFKRSYTYISTIFSSLRWTRGIKNLKYSRSSPLDYRGIITHYAAKNQNG